LFNILISITNHLKGQPSNAKRLTETREEFCKWIDLNRTRNGTLSMTIFILLLCEIKFALGRASGITYFLSPTIRSIKTEKEENQKNETEMCSAFIAYLKSYLNNGIFQVLLLFDTQLLGFNHYAVPSRSEVYDWFNAEFRKDTGVHPNKTDYCNECDEYENAIISIKQTLLLLQKVFLSSFVQSVSIYFIIEQSDQA
jgi:hypothetical protein